MKREKPCHFAITFGSPPPIKRWPPRQSILTKNSQHYALLPEDDERQGIDHTGEQRSYQIRENDRLKQDESARLSL